MKRGNWGIKKQLSIADGFVIIALLFALMHGLVGTGLLPVVKWAGLLPGGFSVVNKLLIQQTIQTLFIVLLVLLFLSIRGSSLRQIGMCRCKQPLWLGKAVLLGIVVFFLLICSGIVLEKLFPQFVQPQAATDMIMQAEGLWEYAVVFVIVSILAPISEELLFRGYIYHSMRAHKSMGYSVAVTSFLFGCMHGDLVRLLPLTLVGICLNLVSVRSGSIWSAIVMHSVWNFMMAALVLLVL